MADLMSSTCKDCLHFETCSVYADDVGGGDGWVTEWCKECERFKDNSKLFPKLKPCPFCGGEAHIFAPEYEGVYVICSNCHARTEALTDQPYFTAYVPAVERVVNKWNRRADDEADNDDI